MKSAVMIVISVLVGGACVALLMWFLRRLRKIEEDIYGKGNYLSLRRHLTMRISTAGKNIRRK